jgi:hypothetical protein
MRLRKLMEMIMVVVLIISIMALKERKTNHNSTLLKAGIIPKNTSIFRTVSR